MALYLLMIQYTVGFRKAFVHGASFAKIQLALLLVNWPGNQYNIYMYAVRGEMLKQTSLTIYCAIIKDVKIQKYIF